jgi:rare lipoprotein A
LPRRPSRIALATAGIGVAGAIVGGIASTAMASPSSPSTPSPPAASTPFLAPLADSAAHVQQVRVRQEQAATAAAARASRAAALHAAAVRSAAQRAAAAAAAARASRSQIRTALSPNPSTVAGESSATGTSFAGIASWYGDGFNGQATASGTTYDEDGLSAASRTLPLGSRLRVCRGSACVVVVIDDRGPYVGGRILDLSRGAASELGMLGAGVAYVTATPVS